MGKKFRADRSKVTGPAVAPGQPASSTLSAPASAAAPAEVGAVTPLMSGVETRSAVRSPGPVEVAGPSVSVRRWLGGAICLHFLLIAAGYLAVVRPSSLQTRLVDGFAAYLRVLHWVPEPGAADAEAPAEGVAFFLARGAGLERSYRLQFHGGAEGQETQWYDAPFDIGSPGSERRRRHSRFWAVIAELGLSDQNALAARLLSPIAQAYPEVNRVRIIRLPNLMTNVVQDAESPPYTASIIRQGGSIRFVREPIPRLGSAAIP
ncbi:MAG: hypothetical protein EA381_19945 [Planctomycetaceae bacterium]|nr:MAG: hypothetical protein EA381_19945 [Planctomycetaceae bacterium]